MVERGYRGSSNVGLLEKWNRELMDENKSLKEKMGSLADVKSPIGSRTLKECETVIDMGMRAHVDAWMALKEIHDRKLYQPTYEDFKEYCLGRWGYRAEGYRYLKAANVCHAIQVSQVETLPPTSAHATALAPLLDDPDKLKEAWNLALELNDGHPTFLEVRDIVQGFLPKKPDSPRGDNSVDVPSAADSGGNETLPSTELPLPDLQLVNDGKGMDIETSSPNVLVPPSDMQTTADVLAPESVSGSEQVPTWATEPSPTTPSFSLPNNSEWTLDTVRQYESNVNAYIRTVAKLAPSNPDRKVWLESVYSFVKQTLGYDI